MSHNPIHHGSDPKLIALVKMLEEMDAIEPPGISIEESMEELGIDLPIFCIHMDLTPKDARSLLIGEMPLTEEMANNLEKLLNTPAHVWLKREAYYRTHIQKCMEPIYPNSNIPGIDAWLSTDKNGKQIQEGDILKSNLNLELTSTNFHQPGDSQEYGPVAPYGKYLVCLFKGNYLLNEYVKEHCTIKD